MAAYIPDASTTGFQIVNRTTTADSSLRIEGVPEVVGYYLRLHNLRCHSVVPVWYKVTWTSA